MTLRLVASEGDLQSEGIGALSEAFLERAEDERHSSFFLNPPLIVGDEQELADVIKGLWGRGFGWIRRIEAIEQALTPEPELDKALYDCATYVGPRGVSSISLNRWTDHAGIAIEPVQGLYRLTPGMLAQWGPQFWLGRKGRQVSTPWTLIARREKP